MKYVVALASLYTNLNKIHFVEASTPVEAMKKVLELPSEEPFESVEQLQQVTIQPHHKVS